MFASSTVSRADRTVSGTAHIDFRREAVAARLG